MLWLTYVSSRMLPTTELKVHKKLSSKYACPKTLILEPAVLDYETSLGPGFGKVSLAHPLGRRKIKLLQSCLL